MIIASVSIAVLLVLSAVFALSETALTAASKALMHEREKDGDRRARMVNQLLARRNRLIGTVLLGNNLANILGSALATSVLIEWFGNSGVVYATAGMTVLVLVFGEVLPKTWALSHPNAVALQVAPLMKMLVWLFTPVTWIVEGVVGLTLKLFNHNIAQRPSAETVLAELRGVIDLHTQALVEADQDTRTERAMLRSVLDLADVEVAEIMVHRRNVVAIDAGQPVATIVDQVLQSSFTRLPLWRERPDNIVGVLHAKALFRALHAHKGPIETLDIESLMSPPWFIPDATTLVDQLEAFRARREHFALVVDEYGSLMGVVTLEDILEEIVGDISDETDVMVAGVRPQSDGSFVVNGDVTIRDLNRRFEWNLPDDEAATVAGLLLHESRVIPDVGQVFLFHGFRFEIIRRQRNQITTVRVTRLAVE